VRALQARAGQQRAAARVHGARHRRGGQPRQEVVRLARDGLSSTLWTVGHSTRSLEELVELLRGQAIELLGDVRTVPKSRRHPHFATDALAASLPEQGIAYRHLAGLGGWRKRLPDSPNGGWRNRSFQGYADYMLTADFERALAELRELADAQRTAIMCSEAPWWRCHRRLIADRLTADGWAVCHIVGPGRVSAHELADFAVVREDGKVIYPA
jgi:uncharacterized protein (DUF488 family)